MATCFLQREAAVSLSDEQHLAEVVALMGPLRLDFSNEAKSVWNTRTSKVRIQSLLHFR